jgi:hypothetical protein
MLDKGQGLVKLLDESYFRVLGINILEECEGFMDMDEFDDQIPTTQIKENFCFLAWYKDIFLPSNSTMPIRYKSF